MLVHLIAVLIALAISCFAMKKRYLPRIDKPRGYHETY